MRDGLTQGHSNNDVCSAACAGRGGVIIYLLLYLSLYGSYKACSQAQQLQAGHLRWQTLAVCISVQFQNFNNHKVHFSKIWFFLLNPAKSTDLFLLPSAKQSRQKLIPVQSSRDTQEPTVLHRKGLRTNKTQDPGGTLNSISSFVKILLKVFDLCHKLREINC